MDIKFNRLDFYKERQNIFCEFGEKIQIMLMNMVDEWIRNVCGVYKEVF